MLQEILAELFIAILKPGCRYHPSRKEAVAAAEPEMVKVSEKMAAYLKDKPFLTGENPTLVDLTLYEIFCTINAIRGNGKYVGGMRNEDLWN